MRKRAIKRGLPRGPIHHVVIIVKENHTFDNYFGTYPGADGATRGKSLQCDKGNTPGPTIKLTPALFQPCRERGYGPPERRWVTDPERGELAEGAGALLRDPEHRHRILPTRRPYWLRFH